MVDDGEATSALLEHGQACRLEIGAWVDDPSIERPVASRGRVCGAWPQVVAVYDGDQQACVCEQGAVHMVVGEQGAKFGGRCRLPVNLDTTEHGVTHGRGGRLRGFRK